MFFPSFVQAHAAHADWREAMERCQRQLEAQIAARAAQQGDSAPFTLGWCYLSDYYAPAAEAILDDLRLRFPGLAWVGTVGVGVAASGVEYIDEPALVLMIAPLPRQSFRLFSGLQPLPAVSSGFTAHAAQVHAEGSTPDLQELIHEFSARTATGYLFGGLASARNRTVHIADGVFTGGISGVAFGPEVDLISRVTQGCQPIGPWRNITEGERNFVVSLDGKPALDCVLQDLGLDRALSDHALSQALSGTLVGLITTAEDVPTRPGQFGADTIVRHLVGVIPQYRALAIAEQIEPQHALGFLHAQCGRRKARSCAHRHRNPRRAGEWRGTAHGGGGIRELLGTRRPALRRAAWRVAGGAACLGRSATGWLFRRWRDRKTSPLWLHRGIDGVCLTSRLNPGSTRTGLRCYRLLHAPLGDESPDKENDNGADDCADEPGTLAGRIPPKCLPEIARNDRSHDAENRRQHETRRLVLARHDELSDHPGDKPNDDRPDNTHGLLL